jgi:transposase
MVQALGTTDPPHSPNIRIEVRCGDQSIPVADRHQRQRSARLGCVSGSQAWLRAHVIDKGIPTTGLLASVLVSKYADHLPLYREEQIFAREGCAPWPTTSLSAMQANNEVRSGHMRATVLGLQTKREHVREQIIQWHGYRDHHRALYAVRQHVLQDSLLQQLYRAIFI